MKLWQKDSTDTSSQVDAFTTGRDREFDLLLAKYDVQGSIAHVTMLGEVGLMSKEEARDAVQGLRQIATEIEAGQFTIPEDAEDVHSRIEFLLTERIGETGKKIHSGRSRNDQVALDIKLYLRAEILDLKEEVKALFDLLIVQAEKNKEYLLPGYTHLQLGMPSSFGLWLSAYAESLVDDLEVVLASYKVVDKNPLGSGAGYGSSFPLDRKRTTELLGFSAMNYNSVYAQMTRGKSEKIVAMGISSIAATLARLAMDCCLYMNQNFGFISFPDTLTTGSSIMPHKKNPDVFELIRGKCNRLQSVPNELSMMMINLPSGYHRELQLTKEILFPAIQELTSCLQMTRLMMENLQVKKDILEDEKYLHLFTVEAVNELVNQGVSFRDAYKQVGEQVEKKQFTRKKRSVEHTHEGSITNLCLDGISAEFLRVYRQFTPRNNTNNE